MSNPLWRDCAAIIATLAGLALAMRGIGQPFQGETVCDIIVGEDCPLQEPIPCSYDHSCCHYSLFSDSGCVVMTRFTCCPLPLDGPPLGCWANWRHTEDGSFLYVWCGGPGDDPYGQGGINELEIFDDLP